MLEGPPAVSPGATWPTGVPVTGMQMRNLFSPSELSTTTVSHKSVSTQLQYSLQVSGLPWSVIHMGHVTFVPRTVHLLCRSVPMATCVAKSPSGQEGKIPGEHN